MVPLITHGADRRTLPPGFTPRDEACNAETREAVEGDGEDSARGEDDVEEEKYVDFDATFEPDWQRTRRLIVSIGFGLLAVLWARPLRPWPRRSSRRPLRRPPWPRPLHKQSPPAPPCVEKASVLRLATRLKMQHKQRRRAPSLTYQAPLLHLPESPSCAELPELARALPPRLDVLERVFVQLGRVGERVAAPPRDDGRPTSVDHGVARALPDVGRDCRLVHLGAM